MEVADALRRSEMPPETCTLTVNDCNLIQVDSGVSCIYFKEGAVCDFTGM